MLDVVCMHAAACDVAIADSGFRHMAKPGCGNSLVASLAAMLNQARKKFPPSAEAERLLALMDFQLARTLAAGMPVRSTCGSCRCSRHGAPSPHALRDFVQQHAQDGRLYRLAVQCHAPVP